MRVSQFAAPTYDEKRHHFLWRFWPALPGWGGMAVFDRSWYGRVLVERVEGFATEEQWQRAYDEIVGFETHPGGRGHDPGQVLDAPLPRGAGRAGSTGARTTRSSPGSSPTRTGATGRSATQYVAAVEDMLARTDHPAAPWHVVPAEDKRYARVAVVRQVCEAIEAAVPGLA